MHGRRARQPGVSGRRRGSSRASLKLMAAHRKPLLIVELTDPATGASSWFGAATAVS